MLSADRFAARQELPYVAMPGYRLLDEQAGVGVRGLLVNTSNTSANAPGNASVVYVVAQG